MALQQCVKCGQVEMTWAIDEEVSKHTYWYCTYCKGVVAWEDESKKRDCSLCGHSQGQMFMWTKDEAFWYCSVCHKKILFDGKRPDWIEF